MFEDIIRILFYLTAAYILYKFISPVIVDFLTPMLTGRRPQEDHDIDELIRKKEGLLKERFSPASKESTQNEISKKIKEIKTKGDLTEKETKNCDLHLKILRDSQWGEGPEVRKLAQKLYDKTGIRPDYKKLFSLIERILAYQLDEQKIPSLEVLSSTLALYFIFTELKNENSFFSKMLSQKHQVDHSTLLLSLEEFSKKTYGTKVAPPEEHILHSTSEHKFEKIFTELDLTIKSFASFSSLSKIFKKDLSSSLQIFQLESTPNLEVLEQKKRILQKQYHPDKYASREIDELTSKVLTENYQIIQEAYDLIKKDINKNEKK